MFSLIMCMALFFGHFIKGITGFGSALISIPIMSFVFAPADAIVIALLSDVCIGAYLTWVERRVVVWRVLPAMLTGVFIGQQVGVFIQKRLDEDTVRICMAFLISFFAVRLLLGAGVLKRRIRFRTAAGGVAGLGAGVMSGLVGSSGPPVVLYTTSYFDKTKGRGILIAFFFLSAISLVLTLINRGMVSQEAYMFGGFGVLVSLIAASIGSWLSPKVSQIFFTRLVAFLLLFCAASMLFIVLLR